MTEPVKRANSNIRRISWYIICTGLAISIPSSLSCMDLLLLRMHFDYALFGVIKSSMFLLPPLVYFFAADAIRRSGRNDAICRWSYLIRILLPLLLPVVALFTEDPGIRLWTWILVLSLSFTAAMFANNTLLGLYHETIVSREFNRYSMFFTALLSVPAMLPAIPVLFLLGHVQCTDREFLLLYLLLEGAMALCYIPAFLVLRHFAKLRHSTPDRKLKFRDKLRPFADRSYLPVLLLTLTRSVWNGMMICYWIIYLITVCKWNIGYITTVETGLCFLLMTVSKPFGKIADTRGYRFCFSFTIFIMIAAAGLQLLCWGNFWITVLFFIVIHNGGNGLFSSLHTNLCNSAAYTLAGPECRENYFAVFTLCGSMGSFAGACLGGALLKQICGSAVPDAHAFLIYFGITSLLLLPQLYLACRLQRGNA